MSIGETHRKVGEMLRAATSECAKPGITFILPWRMDANQDHLSKGLAECGCGCCPDDEQKPI